jgi:hypothetical protein
MCTQDHVRSQVGFADLDVLHTFQKQPASCESSLLAQQQQTDVCPEPCITPSPVNAFSPHGTAEGLQIGAKAEIALYLQARTGPTV